MRGERVRAESGGLRKMGVIVLNEELGIVFDTDSMKVGEAKPGFYKINLSPIEEQINVLETAVEDLFNCLDPTTSFAMAQPNREGALNRAGFITMFWVGLIFGLLFIAIMLFGMGGGV